jgi:GT2 family glycosyltransferase/precorrin-6B methylase 1
VRLSAIIPTYRRPETLACCLDALCSQRVPFAEILVVARRGDEATAAEVARRSAPVQLVEVEIGAGRPGFVAALNAGVDAVSGDVVSFTDDDAEPHPDWTERIRSYFELDPGLGALGGRDFVYWQGRLDGEESDQVGIVRAWGQLVGNHHVGTGPAREVDVLKGVNLSVRGDLIRSIRFDTRLLGITTEHHSELHLCLAVKRCGYRVLYDPAVAVDHRPAPRTAEGREHNVRQVRNAAHNETLALLEHLPGRERTAHLAFALGVGTRGTPGLAQSLRLLATTGDPRFDLLRANWAGRRRALATYRRSRRAGVLAIADSASGSERAWQLLAGVRGARVLDSPSSLAAMAAVLRTPARNLYLVDIGRATAPAALLGRLRRRRLIVDTGDAVFALARSLGDRGFAGLLLVGAGEKLALRSADMVVVRGRLHAEHLARPAVCIPDLAPAGAGSVPTEPLRAELGLGDGFVVGLVGSLILSPRLGVSYGWDLIEALARTDERVLALIVGEGSGRAGLEARARALGVDGRCRFVGRVEPSRVSAYVCAMDAAISTQTNDLVGRVRTTGKLPLYLTCERPVLASHVGEAARLLGPHGWTIPFRGRLDRAYPDRLATRIEAWRAEPDAVDGRRALAARIAAAEFDPVTMRARLRELLTAEGER